MLDPRQFLLFVIRPTLEDIHLGGKSAEVLLLGTAIAESGLAYLRQRGDGPALGLYQMEPATHDDIWRNYVTYHPGIFGNLIQTTHCGAEPDAEALIWNLRYATAMTRIHYLRVPEPLPDAADGEAMAAYHKRHYNTALGKADPARNTEHFLKAYLTVDQTR